MYQTLLIKRNYKDFGRRNNNAEGVLFTCILCPFTSCEEVLIGIIFILAAIATVVTIAEILKNNGLVVEKSE